MDKFKGNEAVSYDSDIVKRVPGYLALQELAAAILTELLPPAANLLVVGAGTGAELARLADLNPQWRFVAVDPSKAMLDQARRRLGATARVTWLAGTVDDLPREDPCFDGAISLLVSHFLPDTGEKGRFFSAIAAQLKAAAPLVTAELFVLAGEAATPALLARWAGLGVEEALSMTARMERLFFPVGPARFAELVGHAGFNSPEVFFEALQFRGSLVRKVGDVRAEDQSARSSQRSTAMTRLRPSLASNPG